MGRLFIQHYRLVLKIGQQPLDTALAPDAGLFKSPEGDGKLSLEAVVPHRAGAEPTGRAISAPGIVGEHRCIQTEYRIIGDIQSMLFAINGKHANDRPKYFLPRDRTPLNDLAANSRFENESPIHMGREPPARRHALTLRHAFGDATLHPP